jgi:hypothetical protein
VKRTDMRVDTRGTLSLRFPVMDGRGDDMAICSDGPAIGRHCTTVAVFEINSTRHHAGADVADKCLPANMLSTRRKAEQRQVPTHHLPRLLVRSRRPLQLRNKISPRGVRHGIGKVGLNRRCSLRRAN